MKLKTYNITGVFKNIPGKGTDDTSLAKKYGTQITFSLRTVYAPKKPSVKLKMKHVNGSH